MVNQLKMAIKNPLRNKRRTLITEITIIFGVVVILFSAAFLNSMSDNWRNIIIDADLGHVQVMASGYKEKIASFPMDKPITDVDHVENKIEAYPGVIAATKRISISGLISSETESAPFFGRGVNTEDVLTVLPKLYGSLVEGEALNATTEGQALLGKGLAKLLKAKVGDRLLLASYDKYKALNAVEIMVAGILNIPEESTNDRLVITDYQTASSLVGYENESTELVVRVNDENHINLIVQELRDTFGQADGLDFYAWSEFAGNYLQAANMFSLVSFVIGGILYFVVLLTLANTVLTSVFERMGEIGMMVALGTSRLQLTTILVLESVVLGLIGVVVGTAIHAGIIYLLASNGISVPPPPGSTEIIVLHPSFDQREVVSVGCLMILVSALAAVYPSFFAANKNPIQAIRGL